MALQRWGEPRQTVDVDLTLLTGFGSEEAFITPLVEEFEPRIPDARRFAIEHRVLLLRSASGVGLDIALGALPFEERAVSRSSLFAYTADIALRTCSAEDLIVMKAFASRGQDWVDVERVIQRQGETLDWPYIDEQLAPLVELKGEPEILERLDALRRSSS